MNKKMKAIQMEQFGGPEVLTVRDVPVPVPGPGEVQVRLYAAGVNPNEAYIRTGNYAFFHPDLPYTPGFDGAGVVSAVGPGIQTPAIGDRVFVAALLAKRNTGTYAEYVVCDADAVHRLPDHMAFEAGAALGIPALTAYRVLFQRARIRAGETVLIHGASGGVGSLAVQMAKAAGCTVIGTSGTEAGRALIRAAGADLATAHLTEDTIGDIMAFTGGKGPDVIIEFLANRNLVTDLKVIAYYGRIVVVGNRGSLDFEPRLAMNREADILGTALWNAPPDEYAESIRAVGAMLESGALVPHVGDTLPLDAASEAHELVLRRSGNGKLVFIID